MLNSSKSFIEKYRLLISNFSYLSILEIIGLLLPLFTYPYLIRVVGKDLYGVIVYSQAVVAYAIILINFGFNVSATKNVSENRNNPQILSEIFNSIIQIKLLFTFITAFIYSLFVYIYVETDYKLLYYFTFGLCIQEVLFPIWFFQGIERMKYITFISFTVKTFFTASIFIFIKGNQDYIFIPILNSLGGILSALLAVLIIRRKYAIKFNWVPVVVLKKYFKESIPFFFSRAASVIIERSNTIIVGLFFGYGMVASFDLALKVINIMKIPFTLVAQVLYPNVARTKNMQLVKKVLILVGLIGTILSFIVCIFSTQIVSLLGGKELYDSIPPLIILSTYLPIVGCSYILGASTLVVMNYIKEYNYSVLYSLVVYLLLVIVFIYLDMINLISLSIIYIVPELFIVLYRGYVTYKNKLFNYHI